VLVITFHNKLKPSAIYNGRFYYFCKKVMYSNQIIFGKTNQKIGRLGIAANYGLNSKGIEEAFERGCNYFLYGSILKGYSNEMTKAINNIIKSGKRDKLFISSITFWHNDFLNKISIKKALSKIHTDYLDAVILGLYNNKPSDKIIEGLIKLKEKSIIRFIGLSTHNRKLIPYLLKIKCFDIFHIRYNAIHKGAENDIFPYLNDIETNERPGIVVFTATAHRKLLNSSKIPAGFDIPSAVDCYRFVLKNPFVNVVMTAPANYQQMIENLKLLELPPMEDLEYQKLRKLGDILYKK